MKFLRSVIQRCPRTGEQIFPEICERCMFRQRIWTSNLSKKPLKFTVECKYTFELDKLIGEKIEKNELEEKLSKAVKRMKRGK